MLKSFERPRDHFCVTCMKLETDKVLFAYYTIQWKVFNTVEKYAPVNFTEKARAVMHKADKKSAHWRNFG